MDRLDVDMEDDDHDGIPNYYEDILGTNRNSDDSDGDGLSDQIELFIGTDNLLWDTDGNGTSDGNEDFDKDGLTNVEEVSYVTSCLSSDTDGDGLSDYEEIFEYETDPLLWDTDEDKLSDSVDIKRGFDPGDPDTDDDGIIDGDEVGEQTYKKTIEEDRKPGVTSVAVSFDCAGNIEQEVVIISTYNIDLQSSNVVGLIGTPVDISTDLDFDAAQIVFTYDENELGDTDEDDLCLMWYDEENDLYILLEDSVLDKDNNTITYNTTHFSTYLIVDEVSWKKTWKDNAERYKTEIDQLENSISDKSTGTIYKCYDLGMTWDDAKRFCESMDGHLATITSQREQNIIESLMNEEGSMNSYWIGAERNENRQFVKWITGEPISYEHYKFGRPDNIYEDALMIYRNDNPGSPGNCFGWWNDMFRDGERPGEPFFGKQNVGFICEWNNVDFTDSDGDGLYDKFVIKGIQLSNGQIVYKNTAGYSVDSPEPLKDVTMKIWGTENPCLVFHARYWYGLSDEFIYVDGRENKNTKYFSDERMNYIGHPESFCDDKYNDSREIQLFYEPSKIVNGAAGIHNSYLYLFEENIRLYTTYLIICNQIRKNVPNASSEQSNMVLMPATRCLYIYLCPPNGVFSNSKRREWVDLDLLMDNIYNNSLTKNYLENIKRAEIAIKGVISSTNNEMYIALSPHIMWDGCDYFGTFDSADELITSVLNISAYGAFNAANATLTLHAVYNQADKSAQIDLNYYILDYYDFEKIPLFNELNALGLACSYELYGIHKDTMGMVIGYE